MLNQFPLGSGNSSLYFFGTLIGLKYLTIDISHPELLKCVHVISQEQNLTN